MDGLDHIKVGPILNSSGPEDKKNVYAWIRYLRICLFYSGKITEVTFVLICADAF